MYPDMLIPAGVDRLTIQQSGQAATLSFLLPEKDRAGRPLKRIAGVKVFRRAESSVSAECGSCEDGFSLLRTVYRDRPEQGQIVGRRVVLVDDDVKPGVRYRYAVVVMDGNGDDGARSDTVAATIIDPPVAPGLMVTAGPVEISLAITPSPVSSEYLVVGYNIYRWREQDAVPLTPLNREPISSLTYEDGGLERHQVYCYGVRTLVRTPVGSLVESGMSQRVNTTLKDEIE